MRIYRISCVVLALLFSTTMAAVALRIGPGPLHRRIEQAHVIGVVKVVGFRKGERPLLEMEVYKLYKGSYASGDDNSSRRVYVAASGVTSLYFQRHPFAQYPTGSTYFAFLKQTPAALSDGQRVMEPVEATGESMLPIRNNLINNIDQSSQFRSTHDYLSAIEHLVEVDALADREQKRALLARLKDSALAADNPHLSGAVRVWLLDIERQIEREKLPANSPPDKTSAG